jgi:2-iminobutanoate/2-iminopropanoate deaminase
MTVQRTPHPTGLAISEAVSVDGPGRTIHVSGCIPTVSGTWRDEALDVFDQLDAALRRHCAALTDVVKLTVFVTSFEGLADVNRVRAERFGAELPASTAVQVAGLFGGARLEVEAVAFVPAS